MKLHTRLIPDGMFIFWDAEGEDLSYDLSIYYVVDEEGFLLVNHTPEPGIHCYSFDRIGAGKYLVQLDGYDNGQLMYNDEKLVTVASSMQKTEELMESLIEQMQEIDASLGRLNYIAATLDNIESYTEQLRNCVGNPKTRVEIEYEANKEYQRLVKRYDW